MVTASKMRWIETPDSSMIARFCYDGKEQLLVIGFKNGRTYTYYEVPESVFDKMVLAPSKGQFFLKSIDGLYRYTRI